MIILIHSSKTMRIPAGSSTPATTPLLMKNAVDLHAWLQERTSSELKTMMKISDKLADKTKVQIDMWSPDPERQTPAIDCFVGDIYSGLRAHEMNNDQRKVAQTHLRILSGLYGILRPLDGIMPYRLEMGYKTPGLGAGNLYDYWGENIAATLPRTGPIINASSDEYTKAVLPYVDKSRVITPKFLTYDKHKAMPVFVAVHAKIARGAYARWLILNGSDSYEKLKNFDDLGYVYDADMSSQQEPVYICREFQGLGLSVRLT